MIHFKTDCTANGIILTQCGVGCPNCGACSCQDDKRAIDKLDTLEQLEQRRLLAWHESNQFHARNHITGYSYPAHQLKAIENRIKELSR